MPSTLGFSFRTSKLLIEIVGPELSNSPDEKVGFAHSFVGYRFIFAAFNIASSSGKFDQLFEVLY